MESWVSTYRFDLTVLFTNGLSSNYYDTSSYFRTSMPDPHLLLHLTWGVEITGPWTYLPKTPNDSHRDCRSSFGAENGARTRGVACDAFASTLPPWRLPPTFPLGGLLRSLARGRICQKRRTTATRTVVHRLERKTGLGPATSTLARLRSTN